VIEKFFASFFQKRSASFFEKKEAKKLFDDLGL